ncbi:hypothetical protein [Nocardia sp. SC052]|uniref:hypothetical protein n=1 Tax=Nocardia sichangensis TaxID=3385975 RepID=UPI0039A2516F
MTDTRETVAELLGAALVDARGEHVEVGNNEVTIRGSEGIAAVVDSLLSRALVVPRSEATPRTWNSVYGIPFDALFRGLPDGSLVWRRFTHDAVRVADSIAWIEDARKLDAKFPEGFKEVQP